MSSAKTAAADYRRREWCPIPLKERSKEPNLLELRPYLNRRATEEELGAWSWPGVGIVTGPLSGVLVLDVDGPEGEAELRKHGHPPTPMARTGGGGLHLYFRHPNGHVRTGIRVAPGLDVKASGGYVVAPPSVGPAGRPYEWIVSPQDAELADPPAWLMALLERGRPKGPAGPVGERIPPGERNKELASLAGTMRRRGMGEAEILAALEVANEQRCEPPLEAAEVEKIAASVSRYEPVAEVAYISANGRGGTKPPRAYNLTDLGNSERFVSDHGEDVRYCYPWATWLVWTGARWEKDEAGRAHRLAKETVRGIYQEAAEAGDEDRRKALAKHAARSESADKIRAMLELARSELPVAPDELDADPMLLNTKSGTIDLRTGELCEHRREDLITKIAPVEYRPDAEAPAWGAFLERVLPDEELRGFVRRAAGYSASGDTSEQCLFINHGVGANGKSTFHEAAAAALGDYAMRAPTDMLLARRSGAVPNDVARLKGARFVTAAETEDGRRLAESLVKDLTGQDTITARFMRAEFFDFKPTHKLHLSTNHKPEIRGTDAAIWRRIRLVPWTVTIPPAEQDKKLSEKLRGELAGVLAWIVRGCVEWRHEGLKAPDAVRKATGAYRSEMDVIGAFIEDCCVLRPDASALATPLYVAYKEWCEESGEPIEKQRRFGMRLTERGLRREKVGGVYKWYGIGLRGGGAGPSGGNGPGNEKPSFAGNSAASEDGAGPSGPENTITAREYTSREVIANNGPNGPNGPDSLPTEDQERRIRGLVKRGFSEHSARIEVLAKDHPPGCECEVCL